MQALNSKMAISAFAMVALLATPAFAQKTHKQARPTAATTSGLYNRADTNTVVGTDGRVIGADPDPVIRSYLLRDEGSATGAF